MDHYKDFLVRVPSKKEEVLECLRIAGDEGLTNIELRQIAVRFTGIIYFLRKDGYIIETIKEGHGVFRYVLRGKQDPVDDESPLSILLKEVDKRGTVSAEEFINILSSKNLVLKKLAG